MGLAGPRNRTKISSDPNNTHWSRSTDRFGHKVLTSLGWSPGTVLGADPSSPHHTLASTSHIKVSLKDDNLGIGATLVNSGADECTGLGDLQSLLGRLNGKNNDEIKKEENERKKLSLLGKYGMRFVEGEVYVSSDLSDLVKSMNIGKDNVIKKEEEEEEIIIKKEEEEEDVIIKTEPGTEAKNKRKRKRSDDEDTEITSSETPSSSTEEKFSSSSRKSKKEKKKEKKARKEEKRLRKLEKKAQKDQLKITKSKKKDKKKKNKDTESDSSAYVTAISTPQPASGTSTPSLSSNNNNITTTTNDFAVTGRHVLRSKWIAQKRMSVMDPKALNEILMIKT